ncbi:MAG: threonine/serine exporter family protein [Bdellovibrionota bacterium]
MRGFKNTKSHRRKSGSYPAWLTALAGGGASSTLIYMLGGNRLEVLISFPLGVLIATLQKQLSAGENRRYLADFLSSLAAALISGCLAQYISGINENRIITGGVILLLPGLVLLNAIHEIAQKNLVSGAAKTVEVLIIGSRISFGIGVATALLEIF